MSHELRTPLNSLLILSKLLADNPDRNLTDKQIEFARTIHQAGSDLLALISDILDLSKVEAGKMDIHPASLPLTDVRDYVDRAFRSVAEEKGLTFGLELDEDAPASLITDEQRLQQVLRNLCPTRSSSPRRARSSCASAGARARTRCASPSRTPASGSRRTSCG
jgi:signal transduction histidine kinase